MQLTINDTPVDVADEPDRPLLTVLRDELGLRGTRFGCGAAQCGACMVHLDGQAQPSCQTPLSSVGNRKVTTIEGLAKNGVLDPVQQAFIDEQVPQCGYCMSGQIMSATALLARNPQPSDDEIIEAMRRNLCRCGTYVRIKRAIRRVAESGGESIHAWHQRESIHAWHEKPAEAGWSMNHSILNLLQQVCAYQRRIHSAHIRRTFGTDGGHHCGTQATMRRAAKKPEPATEMVDEQPKSAKQPRVTRRRFLKAALAGGAGLVVLFAGANAGLRYVRGNLDSFVPELPSDPDAWLNVTPEGIVRLKLSKVEMGQGIATAAAQIVAEELGVPYKRVVWHSEATTRDLPEDSFGTNGSLSVIGLYPALRAAAAEARSTLAQLASERSGVPAERFSAVDGRIVSLDDPSLAFAFGDLVKDRQILRVSDDKQALRYVDPAAYKVIGRPVPRLDIPAKVDGTAIYGYDVTLDGMLHGRVARPPVIGAAVEAVDDAQALALPSVAAVVHQDDFVGVVAQTPARAAEALSALKISWRQPERLLQQADIAALLDPSGGTELKQSGDVERALRGAATVLAAEYRTGFATHAPIEPQVGVADVRAESATVYAPTQGPFGLRDTIAEVTGLKAEQVEVVPTLLGGGFGRKSVSDAATEAARLSKAVQRPVRVAWTRSEEFTQGFMRPPTVTRFRAALAQDSIAAWDQQTAGGFVLFAFFPTPLRWVFGTDFGATRGAVGPYTVPNMRVTAAIRELPVKTGSWRGLGLGPNVFAVEQWIDELAGAAGVDPLEWRLRHLAADGAGERTKRVLETAAQAANWGRPLPDGSGRGIACSSDAGTCVAEVVELTVDRASGAVRIDRVIAAVDCGLVINPDIVKAQTEGAIMMGLSAGLLEEIALQDGKWSASSFGEYPIFRIGDAPEIEVVLLENRGAEPGGMGEPPIGPAAAAAGNAIYAAVGARVRTMPMTPQRVLDALRDGGTR